ncbi:hypothetical protein [Streptacidiphilus fuscans]|uniref:Uncharacterized protein n=1 Tax=Streptacidiphilus fuscans TaxID=2789292 RepID=A0A931FGI5_9ACTN|nr:hypothetical protein [Streptacidiphilus fuscans]MBF9072663.1 hypothetical protein [Streptacidiphilus fuscans]
MGNLYDYFAADDDSQALEFFTDDSMDDPFGTVGLKGADPYLLLGTVEAALTGATTAQVEAGPRFCTLLNDPDVEGPWLASLSDSLRDALASASEARLLEAATTWSRTEDGARTAPDLIADFLGRLAQLARHSPARHLYCGIFL